VENEEYFYETLERFYMEYKFNPNIAYLEFPKYENMEAFIKYFKHNCESGKNQILCRTDCKIKTQIKFLDRVPIEDRKEICIKILKWGQKYYRGAIFSKPSKTKQQIDDERKKDINVLKEAQKTLEKFLPKEIKKRKHEKVINHHGEEYIVTTEYTDYESSPIMNGILLEEVQRKLAQIQLDIENSQYKIVPIEYYRGSKEAPKKELEQMLKGIAEVLKLKGKKEVEFFIKWIPNLSPQNSERQ